MNVGCVHSVLMGGFPSVITGGRSLALYDWRAGVCVFIHMSTVFESKLRYDVVNDYTEMIKDWVSCWGPR